MVIAIAAAASSHAAPEVATNQALWQRPWLESRTAHFNVYSCGPTQEVAKITARLEQFCEAYSLLAGARAVASPPIVVMAYPDRQDLVPFLPMRDGKPASLTAFFQRSSDENLIVLPLAGYRGDAFEVVFHEYAHLLLRHNARVWPIWLTEGMAELYSTFTPTNGQQVRIGGELPRHLRVLADQPLMPLDKLFAVTHSSPEYNERQLQGVFYAEAWLLTHYLVAAENGARRAGLGEFTTRLRAGQPPIAAFTNAFHMSLAAMENALKRYLGRGQFPTISLQVPADLWAPRALVRRQLSPAEVCFRLGDQLARVSRPDAAREFFLRAQKLAPASPLSYEGLGSLAASDDNAEAAVRFFGEALRRGSTSFLAYYQYAMQLYQLTGDDQGRHRPIPPEKAAEILRSLQKSITLMPNFAPSQHLLGFLDAAQHNDLAGAEQHLLRATQLEPENEAYVITLAQVQLMRQDQAAARKTLEALQRPYVEARFRELAGQMLREMGGSEERKR